MRSCRIGASVQLAVVPSCHRHNRGRPIRACAALSPTCSVVNATYLSHDHRDKKTTALRLRRVA